MATFRMPYAVMPYARCQMLKPVGGQALPNLDRGECRRRAARGTRKMGKRCEMAKDVLGAMADHHNWGKTIAKLSTAGPRDLGLLEG